MSANESVNESTNVVASVGASALVHVPVPANHQTFLALDYGLKRTGVAVGNRLLRSATPQGTIAAEGDARFAQVQKRIAEW
jgi:putative Holliday junction resolvase